MPPDNHVTTFIPEGAGGGSSIMGPTGPRVNHAVGGIAESTILEVKLDDPWPPLSTPKNKPDP